MSLPSPTTLATLTQIPDAGFLEVEALLESGTESLVLYREGAQVRAWLNICPHAGRRLDWAPGQFLKTKEGQLVCAAHGAAFELSGGECISGPCRGQSLFAVPVRVEDEQVLLG
ncbi:Rieske (2Fe-2S) protein [Xanthomonas citri pv. malvacearum]|uniref:Rieske (2Fe-2S) protein n=3 Tax=Xanthomonas TaxID=338 RepID=A0AA45BV42_XANCM|nr:MULTISPECIES: Rieske (2Fe-2S) protein [Xanthomonas]OOW66239.1 ferredoxin [Xanthomonas campestris pv. thespesiae]OOW79841.1 ferredoxin [Xanthomonas campestris pv. leeana]AOL20531.1 ferredoxin [Xanthomonas citri pv. malvacearum]ASN00304.1 ferredoxin [Xanthomonas citri pv. malvacearum]ASN10589.1 ferredoxin [Xanthomonas citri pv. malvacearum]